VKPVSLRVCSMWSLTPDRKPAIAHNIPNTTPPTMIPNTILPRPPELLTSLLHILYYQKVATERGDKYYHGIQAVFMSFWPLPALNGEGSAVGDNHDAVNGIVKRLQQVGRWPKRKGLAASPRPPHPSWRPSGRSGPPQ